MSSPSWSLPTTRRFGPFRFCLVELPIDIEPAFVMARLVAFTASLNSAPIPRQNVIGLYAAEHRLDRMRALEALCQDLKRRARPYWPADWRQVSV
jgi:hypothetical protein